MCQIQKGYEKISQLGLFVKKKIYEKKKFIFWFQRKKNYLYNKTRHSYVYISPIAGQTTGPNGPKFFVDTQGWPGGDIG